MKTNFTTYLINKPLSIGVVKQHQRHLHHFEKWCAQKLIADPQRLSYTELLNYVEHLKANKLNTHTINIHIDSIRKYYDHLIEQGLKQDNPAKNLRIKGNIQKVRTNLLTTEQIQQFYQQYTQRTHYQNPLDQLSHQRNIVILGLIINQGIHSGEIARMETHDIKLSEGKIYIPSTEKSNSRTLQLHANQIMPINNYLNNIRPLLMAQADQFIPGKAQAIIAHMFKQIRKQNPNITNGLQIRASVIMNWLKQNNIRQVQYMCGHKQISTTESYKQQDLEGLKSQLQKHHPFN